MATLADTENVAGLARITCGWKKQDLPMDWVRKYWRDVHSPAITRRVGIYDYRHYQFDEVRPGILPPLDGIKFECPMEQQLMWLSDVRYRGEKDLAKFDLSPNGEPKKHLLGDIELIVDKSTTYRAIGNNAHTYVDNTGVAMPQGPSLPNTYALFIRQRSNDEDEFRHYLSQVAQCWANSSGVNRLRLSLFEVPDMEAERKAGYPVKTHPLEQQYQAWIDLTLENDQISANLLSDIDLSEFTGHISTIHTYPVRVIYTSVYAGLPTLVGLRGYAAYEAITALDASNQKQASLLEWLYGSTAQYGAIDGVDQ